MLGVLTTDPGAAPTGSDETCWDHDEAMGFSVRKLSWDCSVKKLRVFIFDWQNTAGNRLPSLRYRLPLWWICCPGLSLRRLCDAQYHDSALPSGYADRSDPSTSKLREKNRIAQIRSVEKSTTAMEYKWQSNCLKL